MYKEQITAAFAKGIKEIRVKNFLSMEIMEEMEKYGINPYTAAEHIKLYLKEVDELISKGQAPNIIHIYQFLDKMYEIFCEEYKHVVYRKRGRMD